MLKKNYFLTWNKWKTQEPQRIHPSFREQSIEDLPAGSLPTLNNGYAYKYIWLHRCLAIVQIVAFCLSRVQIVAFSSVLIVAYSEVLVGPSN